MLLVNNSQDSQAILTILVLFVPCVYPCLTSDPDVYAMKAVALTGRTRHFLIIFKNT